MLHYNFKFDRVSSSTWGSRGLVPDQLKKTVGFQSPPRSEKRGMAKKKFVYRWIIIQKMLLLEWLNGLYYMIWLPLMIPEANISSVMAPTC